MPYSGIPPKQFNKYVYKYGNNRHILLTCRLYRHILANISKILANFDIYSPYVDTIDRINKYLYKTGKSGHTAHELGSEQAL